ncbi:ribosome maturation factor RimP [Lentilactobacillus fungorum]|uniref:Ribosome maturation factor RimP n=1 Tax=Lentilactobacillus fungorum TaxID=2201250 RepID=A0ABQ3VW89_9LACO|nr:ribosome maturation factor RimP [Lentilactobacillus fungorum]GHP12683.1 ribosome maturation factor RimP [Lentilactobacillus fungorum]
MSKVVETVKQVVKPILAKHSFYLFDVAFVKEKGGWYLRVYIDKDGGVTIDDCVLVSDELGEKLDEMEPDPIPQAYFLEVSSPGAERPLRNDEELRQAVGEYVNLSLYKNLNGNKSFEGTLKSVTEDQVVLENDQWGKHPTVAIPRDLIAKARLAIKF